MYFRNKIIYLNYHNKTLFCFRYLSGENFPNKEIFRLISKTKGSLIVGLII